MSSDGKARLGFYRSKIGVYVALLAAPILLTVWRYRGQAANFLTWTGEGRGDDLQQLYAYLWQFGSFFALMFLLPIAAFRGKPRRPLVELGLGPPGGARALWLTLLAIPLVVGPIAWFGAKMPEVRAEYPMLHLLGSRPDFVLAYEAAYVLLYYVAWEFFFRGYLLFTLEGEYGGFAAVLIQTISSCLVHIGKPEGEILGSIPVGILFGVIALRTRSIWPTFLLHASLGVMTDLFVLKT